MNIVRVAAGIAALALLIGCGTGSAGHHPTHHWSCANAGSVGPAIPVVQVRTTSQALHAISHVTTVGCRAWVRVHGQTTAAANVTLAPTSQCQLSQVGPGHPANMQIRNPSTVLFTLNPGQVSCYFGHPQEIPLCGIGTVFPSGHSSGLVECSDPLFVVAVYSGTMRVNTPGHQACAVTASHLLNYNFTTGRPVLTEAKFSKAEIRLFHIQANELGIVVAPISPGSPSKCAPE